jgi:hypothetical protein
MKNQGCRLCPKGLIILRKFHFTFEVLESITNVLIYRQFIIF